MNISSADTVGVSLSRLELFGWRGAVEPGIGRVVSAHGDYYHLVCNEAEGEILARKKKSVFARMKTAAMAEREHMKIDAQIGIERKKKELADMKLENAKKDAEAEAYRVGKIMEAYNSLSPEVLIALATLNMEPEKMIAAAFEKLAVNSEKIGTLNITPDLLESLTAR